MIHFFKFIFLFIIYFNQAYSIELVNLRFGSNGEIKRIVLDLTQDTSFDSKVFDKRIEIFFKDEIEVNKKFTTKNDLSEIVYNKKLKKLSLNFNKNIFSTNIYLLKKKKNFHSRIVIDYSSKKKKRKTIIIDPGHGGRDSGAVGIFKNLEKNITLKVGLLLKKRFEQKTNYKVILTRDKDFF